jgi:flagellar hook-length control protein FliK
MEVQLGDMQLSDLIKTSGQTQSKSQSLSDSDQTGSSTAMGRASGEFGTHSSSYNDSNALNRDFEQTLNKRLGSQVQADQSYAESPPEKTPVTLKPSKTKALQGGQSTGQPKAESSDKKNTKDQGVEKQTEDSPVGEMTHAQVLATHRPIHKDLVAPTKSSRATPVAQATLSNAEQASGDTTPLTDSANQVNQVQTPTLSEPVLKAPVKSKDIPVSGNKPQSGGPVVPELATSKVHSQAAAGKNGPVHQANIAPVVDASDTGKSISSKELPQQNAPVIPSNANPVTHPMQGDHPLVKPPVKAGTQAQVQAAKTAHAVDHKVTTVVQPQQDPRTMDQTDGEGHAKQGDQNREGAPGESPSVSVKSSQLSQHSASIDVHALNMQSVLPRPKKTLSTRQSAPESKASAQVSTKETMDLEPLSRQDRVKAFAIGGDTEKPVANMKGRAPAQVSVAHGTEQTTVATEAKSSQVTNTLFPSTSIESTLMDMTLSTTSEVKAVGTSPLPMAALANDSVQSVSQQIMESVHSSIQQGQSRLTIDLHPAELGRVFIKLEEMDGQIAGVLEVTERQTRAEIDQALPQIIQSLQESGISIKRLDVAMSNDNQHNGSKDQSWQPTHENSSGHQNRQDNEEQPARATDYDYDMSPPEPQFEGFTESGQENRVGNSSIDMLA